MARYEFGLPTDEDDVLVVHGVEYKMMPIGMRAIRKMLVVQKSLANRKPEDGLDESELDLAMDIVINAVRPEERDRFREQIEDSIPPNVLVQIATAVMSKMSDLDPTEPESSSGGSSSTGPDSTDGAPAGELTPTL